MSKQLTELVVTDFRSIRGTVSIPLDAPIILIHGANGAGKTSIATALELVLTGDVAALRRSDENVQDHLVNRDADHAEISLRMNGSTVPDAEVSIKAGKIEGSPLLDDEQRTFFCDRCYLSQSTLGRLLDIYQAPASRDPTNTPLTGFVKNLLGLDQLEALIDGLHPAGHKARLTKLSADFDRADQLESRLTAEKREVGLLQSREDAEAADLELRLKPLRETLGLPDDLSAAMEALAKQDDPQLVARHDARVNEIVSLQYQWSSFSTEELQQQARALESDEAKALGDLESHQEGPGKRLVEAIERLRTIFPNVEDPTRTDPEEARRAASEQVDREITRIEALLDAASAAQRTVTTADQSISQLKARLELLNNQIAATAGDTAGLGQALSALLPHTQSDVCPVCNRDFSEVSSVSLRTHLSQEIARLIGKSEQLQSLVDERQQAQNSLSEAERNRGAQAARLLPKPDVTRLQGQLALLRTSRTELAGLSEVAAHEVALRARYTRASDAVARLRRRDSTSAEIRAALSVLASTIGAPPASDTETTQELLSRLIGVTEAAQREARTLQANRAAASDILARLQSLAASKEQRRSDNLARENRLTLLRTAQRTVKQERDLANDLREAACDARTAIVGRVFNERLNAIWRDLFVRLAPNEPFVPAFMLPKEDGAPVSALLETVHRDGGSYGRPGAMLSAGNLNTAALTLFLALHLSVTPELPWLILDDPVQSMDEVHVAQFAALLRTLSKSESRQIVIAVHERQLFDYLALELSPAFVGDKLVTIELNKSPEGTTNYDTRVIGFEPDRLVA